MTAQTYYSGRVYGIYSDTTAGDDLAWERSSYFTAEDAMREARTIWQDEYHRSRRVWVEYNTAYDDEQQTILDLRPTRAPQVRRLSLDTLIQRDTRFGMNARYVTEPVAVSIIGPYAWPGGYAVSYITEDGSTLCPTCARDELVNGWIKRAYVETSDQNDDAYNGNGIMCDGCNEWIVPDAVAERAERSRV